MHVGYHFSLVITFIFMSLQGTSNKSRPATAAKALAAGRSITLPVNKSQLPVYIKQTNSIISDSLQVLA